jgi:hypothetical protein
MDEGMEEHWRELSKEVLSGIKEWWLTHSKTTLCEIKQAVQERMSCLEAQLM